MPCGLRSNLRQCCDRSTEWMSHCEYAQLVNPHMERGAVCTSILYKQNRAAYTVPTWQLCGTHRKFLLAADVFCWLTFVAKQNSCTLEDAVHATTQCAIVPEHKKYPKLATRTSLSVPQGEPVQSANLFFPATCCICAAVSWPCYFRNLWQFGAFF